MKNISSIIFLIFIWKWFSLSSWSQFYTKNMSSTKIVIFDPPSPRITLTHLTLTLSTILSYWRDLDTVNHPLAINLSNILLYQMLSTKLWMFMNLLAKKRSHAVSQSTLHLLFYVYTSSILTLAISYSSHKGSATLWSRTGTKWMS